MSLRNQDLGRKGEDLAVRFLEERGFKILLRNVQLRFGEIDILAEDRGDLVIVEVKTRRSLECGEPAEAVDYEKKRKLWQLAQLLSQQNPTKNIRIDVVAIKIGKKPQIEHIKNAIEWGNQL